MRASSILFYIMHPQPPRTTLFPYTTLFRSRTRPVPAKGRCPGTSLRKLLPANLGHQGRSRKREIDGNRFRSEEHTSELQSHVNLVCRLLLEKKNFVSIISLIVDTTSCVACR